MIAKQYQTIVQNELGYATYLLVTLLVASLQTLKQVKLERLAEALPLPILFESRRKKLQRFLKLEALRIETLWFPCVRCLLDQFFSPGECIYIAIDSTSWGCINILMVSLIYDHRAWPIYWTFLNKKRKQQFSRATGCLKSEFGSAI